MCPPTGHRRTQRGSRSRRDRRTTARASHGGDGFLAPPPSTGAPSVHDASTPPHLHRRLPPPRSKGPFVGALGQPPSLPRAPTLQPVASQTRLVAAALPAALRKAAGRGLSQKNWAGGGGGGAERASPKKEHGGRVSGASRGGPTRDTARTMRGGGDWPWGHPDGRGAHNSGYRGRLGGADCPLPKSQAGGGAQQRQHGLRWRPTPVHPPLDRAS